MAKNVVAWVLIGIGLMMLAHTCSGCGSADVGMYALRAER